MTGSSARTRDIARELCIPPPTVVEMVQKLDRRGLIIYRKYDGVTLTPEGRKIAEVIRDRHVTIRTFLEIMQVTHAVAEKDACMMEHELSPETIDRLRLFLQVLKDDLRASSVMEQFDAYARVKSAALPA